jgi:hypothetical protein
MQWRLPEPASRGGGASPLASLWTGFCSPGPNLAFRDSALRTTGNRLRYLWVRILIGGREAFKCVALRELTYIPIEAREDSDVLCKKGTAGRRLHIAGVDFVYTQRISSP